VSELSLPRKADSAAIESHIEALRTETWLGPAQLWWPQYLFRFDHVTAAASILNDGRLLSRARAIAAGKIVFDSASPGIIAHTGARWKDYVRLYFRPRTPTQFSSEGIRRRSPIDEYRYGGCCPIPVVLLFGAADIMTLEETMFSDGNLASGSTGYGRDAKFLRRIPFQVVYHDDPIEPKAKGTVIRCRHAEVIYPHELGLFALKKICCRSSAERETLISLLTPDAAAQWTRSITSSSKLNLHYRRWTFLEEVELSAGSVNFVFNPSTLTPGPYRLDIHIDSPSGRRAWMAESYLADKRSLINDIGDLAAYNIEIKLDSELIYKNRYERLPEIF
jgi:hypothetical protein